VADSNTRFDYIRLKAAVKGSLYCHRFLQAQVLIQAIASDDELVSFTTPTITV